MPGPTKIGVRGVLIYCADYHCSHSIALMADRWADELRLSDIEDPFACTVCGNRGADARPAELLSVGLPL
jgi:hypothetical protein